MKLDVALDLSLDPLEEKRFLATNEPLMRKMMKKLHFTERELGSTMLLYLHLKKRDGGLPMETFLDVLHKCFDMTDNFFYGRIVFALGKLSGQNSPHGNASAFIPMEMWCYCVSLFTRGTLEEKIKYCYTVYGNGKPILDTVDVFGLMQSTMISMFEEERDELVRDLILSIMLRKMDKDKDGKISFEDYRATVYENHNMLECFGPCLPSRYTSLQFLGTFTFDKGKTKNHPKKT